MSFDRYKVRGSFNPVFYCCDSTDDNITKYQIYYPRELENIQDRRFPVIVIVNGINEPAYQYRHVFEHLASWGFIVVGNYDIDSWKGYSTHASLELLLQLNQTPDTVFYDKVDVDNIGVLGHSEGGVGALNAVTKYKNSFLFKTIYTASIPSLFIAKFMGWSYDVTQLKIPYCMVQGTEPLDSALISPQASAIENYNKISEDVLKIRARYDKGTHNDTLWKILEGYTAWFMWHLQKDNDAKHIFKGENAAILSDWQWRDIQKNF